MKKKVILIISICVILLIGAFIADRILNKSYFVELKYDEAIKKFENKEDFVLLISQTTCSHCIQYKPKLEDVANEYKVYIYYIDVDLIENEDNYKKLKSYVNFDGTPVTAFIIDGGEETAATRINGDTDKDIILKKLKSNGFLK